MSTNVFNEPKGVSDHFLFTVCVCVRGGEEGGWGLIWVRMCVFLFVMVIVEAGRFTFHYFYPHLHR